MVDAFDRLSVEEAIRICDPEVELTTLLDRLGHDRLRGHDGLRDWFERMGEIWALIDVRDWRAEQLGDWILTTGRVRLRATTSPQEMEIDWVGAAKVSDGGFTRLGVYLDREEALAAIEEDG
jgi:hypothetical protein